MFVEGRDWGGGGSDGLLHKKTAGLQWLIDGRGDI